MSDTLTPDQEAAGVARADATGAIMAHAGTKRVIVAGPGTGKTHLFKQVLASKEGEKTLTLTFINALVEDLCLELHGMSDVRTLHGYALSTLRGGVKIFPKLPAIIQEDGEILLGQKVAFTEKIHGLDKTDGHLDFYSARQKYYNRFGYSDIIMELVTLFQEHPDKIPEYAQVVVDEFQDFNKLEVMLIEQLALKSPILIAGDDDQAIYEFKNSTPDFIRGLHADTNPDYASFPLPFCSRSTRVIVDAINDFIASAVSNGFLVGRVNKPYLYFPCPPKDAESAANPKIVHKRLEDAQIPWFIESEIDKVAGKLRKKFDVLVIAPYSSQCQRIGKALRSKGFDAVEFKEKDTEKMPYLDGLRVLTTDRNSNLGWRIVSKALLPADEFSAVLKKTEDCSKPFRSFLTPPFKDEVERDVKTLKAVIEAENLDKTDAEVLLGRLGFESESINKEFLETKFGHAENEGSCNPGIRKIPITITTVQSSKGLAADYVFITHFDKRYMGEGGITNQSICNFLVALTRARKKVWLLSTSNDTNPFLGWIKKEKIESA